MEVIKIFISFLPTIIVGFFYLLVNKKKVNLNNLLNIFLVSFFLIFFYMITYKITTFLGAVLYLGMQKIIPNISMEYGFGLFFKAFISAGLCEEIAKWVGIKVLKPKNKREIVVFAIFVATFLSSMENNSFIQRFGLLTGIYRAFMDMHIVFQVVMSFFMVKAFDKKNNGKKMQSHLIQMLAMLIPAILHGIYDAIFWDVTVEGQSILVPIAFGIFVYGITFWTIYKYRDYDELEEENPKKASKAKIIFAILVLIFDLYTFKGFANNDVKVEQNNNISYIENRVE